jgi:hypothetical protein
MNLNDPDINPLPNKNALKKEVETLKTEIEVQKKTHIKSREELQKTQGELQIATLQISQLENLLDATRKQRDAAVELCKAWRKLYPTSTILETQETALHIQTQNNEKLELAQEALKKLGKTRFVLPASPESRSQASHPYKWVVQSRSSKTEWKDTDLGGETLQETYIEALILTENPNHSWGGPDRMTRIVPACQIGPRPKPKTWTQAEIGQRTSRQA